MPIRSSQSVLRRDSRFAQKIRVTLASRELDADWLECLAVKRAVDDVPRERRTLHRVPAHLYVAVVAHRSDVCWNRQRGRFLFRGIVTHAYFIDDQRMPHAIGAALMKDNVPQKLWAKLVNRCGGKISQWDSSLNPTASRDVARVGSQRHRRSEGCGQTSDFQTLAGVGEHDQRQTAGCDRARRVTPEIKVVPAEVGKPITIPVHP